MKTKLTILGAAVGLVGIALLAVQWGKGRCPGK